jgi:hypothetical protein
MDGRKKQTKRQEKDRLELLLRDEQRQRSVAERMERRSSTVREKVIDEVARRIKAMPGVQVAAEWSRYSNPWLELVSEDEDARYGIRRLAEKCGLRVDIGKFSIAGADIIIRTREEQSTYAKERIDFRDFH